MMGEGIMTRNNPFLGLYNQVIRGLNNVNPGVCKNNRKGFREALPVKEHAAVDVSSV